MLQKLISKRRLMKDQKGFTLVELLVVLAILAILIAVAVPVMVGALNDAKEKTAMSDARAAYIAYILKDSTTTDVKLADIKSYLYGDDAKDQDAKLKIAVEKNKAGDVVAFYYQNTFLSERGSGKYVKISMGDQATVDTGAFPTATTVAGNTLTTLS